MERVRRTLAQSTSTGLHRSGRSIRDPGVGLDLNNGTQRFYKIDTDTLETTNLLTRALNATETTNYNYLCNQMTTLVGTGGFCTLTLTQEVNKGLDFTISPNPTQEILTIQVPISETFNGAIESF